MCIFSASPFLSVYLLFSIEWFRGEVTWDFPGILFQEKRWYLGRGGVRAFPVQVALIYARASCFLGVCTHTSCRRNEEWFRNGCQMGRWPLGDWQPPYTVHPSSTIPPPSAPHFSYSNIHTHLPLERSSLTFLILPELYKLNSSTSLSLQCILYSATVCVFMYDTDILRWNSETFNLSFLSGFSTLCLPGGNVKKNLGEWLSHNCCWVCVCILGDRYGRARSFLTVAAVAIGRRSSSESS